jgi:ATP-binding cassette subfamily B protein
VRAVDVVGRIRDTTKKRSDLVRQLAYASPGLVAASVVTSIVSGLLPVSLMIAGGALTQRIADALAAGEGAARDLRPVYVAFVVVMVLFLASEILVPLQNRLRWLVTKTVDGVARQRVIAATLAGTDMRRLHEPEYLEALGMAEGLVRWSATPGDGAAGMIGLLGNYVAGSAAAVLLATYNPLIAAVALVVALAVRVRWRRSILRIIDAWIEGGRGRRETTYFTELGLGRAAGHEVRLFGLGDWLRQRLKVAAIEGWTPTWRERTKTHLASTTIDLVVTGAVAAASLVWAARAAARGELTVGDLVVLVTSLFGTLGMGRYFHEDTPVAYGTVTLPAIATLERLGGETVTEESGSGVTRSSAPPTVELRGVTFGYPGSERPVLRGVDLAIPAGSSLALVGLNGAGKTTLARLLCGLYRPDQGSVRIDGLDLTEWDLAAWHRRIAPMFQEFLRLPVSVRENVAVGAVEHLDDERGVMSALDDAGATGFVERLAEGSGSLLATRYADGVDLSGGQWQRIGMARALFALRHGARFLILDEPTSNLDTSSEERLLRRLLDDTKGEATTLLITHRLALARRTDRIVVLERGEIVEEGSHEELIATGDRYADAFGAQAAMYPMEAPDA